MIMIILTWINFVITLGIVSVWVYKYVKVWYHTRFEKTTWTNAKYGFTIWKNDQPSYPWDPYVSSHGIFWFEWRDGDKMDSRDYREKKKLPPLKIRFGFYNDI